MNPQQVIDISSKLVFAIAELSLPLLITALIVGLIVSIFQAATQINESTLSFLPKVAAMLAVLMFIAPWMIRKMTDFTQDLYNQIPAITKQK